MKVVVDTDVIAAALLGEGAAGDDAALLLSTARELSAPSHWPAELANVVWKAVRGGRLALEGGARVLDVADTLPIVPVRVTELWRGALARAVSANVAVYDALFVELAVMLGCPLASYDRQLHVRFRGIVVEPRALLRR